jgi:hypothetical protein
MLRNSNISTIHLMLLKFFPIDVATATPTATPPLRNALKNNKAMLE